MGVGAGVGVGVGAGVGVGVGAGVGVGVGVGSGVGVGVGAGVAVGVAAGVGVGVGEGVGVGAGVGDGVGVGVAVVELVFTLNLMSICTLPQPVWPARSVMQMVRVCDPPGPSSSTSIFTVSVRLMIWTRSISADRPAIVAVTGGSAPKPADELTVDSVFSDESAFTD